MVPIIPKIVVPCFRTFFDGTSTTVTYTIPRGDRRAGAPDAVGELLAAASRRTGLATAVRAHQLRHVLSA